MPVIEAQCASILKLTITGISTMSGRPDSGMAGRSGQLAGQVRGVGR